MKPHFKASRHPTILRWSGTGPTNDPKLNALDHLRRYNFTVDGTAITPPSGFRLSREDQMAVDYLVATWGYTYTG